MRRRDEEPLLQAQRALAEGNHAEAQLILSGALEDEHDTQRRQLLLLELAASYLLAGDDWLQLALAAIDAAEAETGEAPARAEAMRVEIAALYGESGTVVAARLRSLRLEGDALAQFHAASALLLVGLPESALDRLEAARSAGLPQHLSWRAFSLAGVAHEQLGDFIRAAEAISTAVRLAPPGESVNLERLALADCLLELGDARTALKVTGAIERKALNRPEDHVYLQWLQARAEQQLGNPGLAVEYYRRARLQLSQLPAVPPGVPYDAHSLCIAEAQLLADLGHHAEAIRVYREALLAADPLQVSLTRHELAVVLAEAGRTEEAKSELRLAAADADYEWRPEATAELADLAYQEGDNPEAERLAAAALALRPVASAYLCLGSIAADYYRLHEAVSWFERAAETATDGDPSWLAAQQLLADTLAQMGPENAERLYLHAQAALKYTDSRNDWYLPLRAHAESAHRLLSSQRRLVN